MKFQYFQTVVTYITLYGLLLCCLTPLSTIFQLYKWRKQQVADKLSHNVSSTPRDEGGSNSIGERHRLYK